MVCWNAWVIWFKLNILLFSNLEKVDLHSGSHVTMSITFFQILQFCFFLLSLQLFTFLYLPVWPFTSSIHIKYMIILIGLEIYFPFKWWTNIFFSFFFINSAYELTELLAILMVIYLFFKGSMLQMWILQSGNSQKWFMMHKSNFLITPS